MLVLGRSEERSRKTECPGTSGYGFATALAKKSFVVGLPSQRSSCIKFMKMKVDIPLWKRQFQVFLNHKEMDKQKEILYLICSYRG